MKKVYILGIALALLCFVLICFIYFYRDKTADEDNLVGGDKDDHECITSAGYSWNETKQKCVREWEEILKQKCSDLGCGEDMLFAGSINSDKYYNCDCSYANKIKPENLICFSSDEEAVADGRTKSEC